MKSEQTMLVRFGVAVLLLASLVGCSQTTAFRTPQHLVSPYDAVGGDVLWAIAPLRNESGDNNTDPEAITQALFEAVNKIEGVTCIPPYRTSSVIRQLRMSAITSPNEAYTLAEALGADGIIVGSITAFDPYDPPTLGLTLALHSRAQVRANLSNVDINGLRGAPTPGLIPAGTTYRNAPNAVISYTADGNNDTVRREVHRYAEGRHDPTDALGWERYMASMDLFTEFAAHAAVARLLDRERLRIDGGQRTGP